MTDDMPEGFEPADLGIGFGRAFGPVGLDRAGHRMLAPAALGAWVEAAGTLVRQTRTMLFTRAIITVDGDPVARSSAIYRIRNTTGAWT